MALPSSPDESASVMVMVSSFLTGSLRVNSAVLPSMATAVTALAEPLMVTVKAQVVAVVVLSSLLTSVAL